MSIIELQGVTKEFRLGQSRSFRDTLAGIARRALGKPQEERRPFKALDELTLNIDRGEVIGIIGHNGAGKSTLLKLIANITQPTRGSVRVNGRVAPLIEVGAGLVPEMTGRENIYLNAGILGMKMREIERKLDDIVAFAELEEFIETPLKRYSSGMQVRLGFAIATAIDAEILIVDEVLAVGDLAFQRKCFDRLEQLIKARGSTVLVVSHNLRHVERLCPRVIMLEAGHVVADGRGADVCRHFLDRSNEKIKLDAEGTSSRGVTTTDELGFGELQLLDERGQPTDNPHFLRPCSVRISFEALRPLKRVGFMVGTHTTDFIYLTANNTMDHPVDLDPGWHVAELKVDAVTLLPGVYSFRLWIGTPEGLVLFKAENLRPFQVTSDSGNLIEQQHKAVVFMAGSWLLPASERTSAMDAIDQGSGCPSEPSSQEPAINALNRAPTSPS